MLYAVPKVEPFKLSLWCLLTSETKYREPEQQKTNSATSDLQVLRVSAHTDIKHCETLNPKLLTVCVCGTLICQIKCKYIVRNDLPCTL